MQKAIEGGQLGDRQTESPDTTKRLSKLLKSAVELRAKCREVNPGFDDLPGQEQHRVWAAYLGLPTPTTPSRLNPHQPALCKRCWDSQWLHPVVEGKTDFSNVIPCPDCYGRDLEVEQRARMAIFSGVPDLKLSLRFDHFVLVPGSDNALEAAWQLATGDATFKLLLIYGRAGNGKTHLAMAAVNQVIERGLRARFIYAPDLFAAYRGLIGESGKADEMIVELKGLDFLVIDDIGVEQGTVGQQTLIESIINHRYQYELPLILTTNKAPQALGDAVMSRFEDGRLSRMVLNAAPDYRPQRK